MQNRRDYIEVRPRHIRTENDTDIAVAQFFVGRRPVSVAQYQLFVDSTGYRSTAEIAGVKQSWRMNDAVCEMTGQALLDADAMCMSRADALAYCTWCRCRLPTEAEWIAAAVLDWSREYEAEEYQEVSRMLATRVEALENVGLEWTSSEEAGCGVLRAGPLYALQVGWRRNPARIVRRFDYFDVISSFRVVPLTEQLPAGRRGANA